MINTKRLLKIIKYSALATASLLALVLLVISLLLFTHSGNLLVLKTVKSIESRLSIELIEGSFFNQPQYQHIAWVDGETSINVASLDYEFNWSCLVSGICLTTLNIDGMQVKLPESTEQQIPEEDTDTGPIDINIPLELLADNINLTQFTFEMGELSVDLKKISLQVNAFHKDISLSTQINGLLVVLPESQEVPEIIKRVTNDEKQPIDLALAEIPAFLTQEMLPRIALPINLNVKEVAISDVNIMQNDAAIFTLNNLDTAFTFKKTRLSIPEFSLDLPETLLALTASVNFIDDYPLTLNIDGNIKEVAQLEPETLLTGLRYQLKTEGSLSDLKSELVLSEIIDLQLTSSLNLFAANIPHTLTINWQDLAWPLTGETQFSSKQGRFESQGSLLDHLIELNTEYIIVGAPPGKLALKTKGDLQQLNIETLNIETLDGDIDFSGLLTWQQKIDWKGELAINHIDLKQFESAYDGQFSGLIKQHVAVTLYENSSPSWNFVFPELAVEGTLLSRPFSILGNVSGDDEKGIYFDNVAINNAENILLVDGVFAKENNLNIALDIVDLSHAVIATRGNIKGDVKITGPIESLNIASKLEGQSLSYQDYKVDRVALKSTVMLTEKPQLTLDLNVDTIKAELQAIDNVAIKIDNRRVDSGNFKHKIDLLVKSELVSTDLLVYLTQADELILTQLNQANIYLPHQTLTLETPFDLVSQEKSISLSAHCWSANTQKKASLGQKSDNGELCIKEFNAGESGKVLFNIDNYVLSSLNPFLPEEFKIAGAISADADLKWEKGLNPVFDISFFSDDMLFKISTDPQSNKFIDYPMQDFNISAIGSEQEVVIDAHVFAENLIDVKLKGTALPYEDKPTIDSQVSINLPDFSLFLPLVSQLEVLNGKLTSGLTITGDLKSPIVNGDINIAEGEISSGNLPMRITELQTSINIQDTKADLQGAFNTSDTNTIGEKAADIPLLTNTFGLFDKSLKKVRSEILQTRDKKVVDELDKLSGQAFVQGQFDWSDKFKGDLHFLAHKLEIYEYGKMDLFISPDINIAIGEQIKVLGELFIDKGKVVIKDIPEGAISQSKDIVVIDVEKETTAADVPVIIDLSVDMGQQFQLVAMGLDTFINGKLKIKKPLEKDLSINGELQFVNGSYRSLGQQLVLQKSRVVFQGVPDSPYLKIEAIRDPSKIEDNVIAGVRVTGTPDELELIIFSEPAMAQQEALSYLTRGKALNSSSDSSNMANMLIDIAAGQSGGVMSSIGEEVGIKDLSLSSSGTGDEQSVGIRGEIAPGVEISYGVGVFDSFSIFAIRYEMFERFYVEASSGIHQAVDGYYEWDWD